MNVRETQRLERAACFQKIAEDPHTRPEVRAWFAQQANMLRTVVMLGELRDKRTLNKLSLCRQA